MNRDYRIEKRPGCGGLFVAVDAKTGESIGPLRADESGAALDGHHWAHRPTAFKRYGFKKLADSGPVPVYRARPFWGVEARITRVGASWFISIKVDGEMVATRSYDTREAAAESVGPYGKMEVMTRNILNPEAGEFPIARSEKGGCTDPGTERYHCM